MNLLNNKTQNLIRCFPELCNLYPVSQVGSCTRDEREHMLSLDELFLNKGSDEERWVKDAVQLHKSDWDLSLNNSSEPFQSIHQD